MHLPLLTYQPGDLAGGRPLKLVKEGVSEKTLARRFKELDAAVDTGMHLGPEIVTKVSRRYGIVEQMASVFSERR